MTGQPDATMVPRISSLRSPRSKPASLQACERVIGIRYSVFGLRIRYSVLLRRSELGCLCLSATRRDSHSRSLVRSPLARLLARSYSPTYFLGRRHQRRSVDPLTRTERNARLRMRCPMVLWWADPRCPESDSTRLPAGCGGCCGEVWGSRRSEQEGAKKEGVGSVDKGYDHA